MKIQRSSEPELFLSKNERKLIVDAIREAEKATSGEIRVHLEKQIRGEILEHGREIFEKIGMTATEGRNGVLILLGVKSKRFVVLGDIGIHEKVPANFWDDVVGAMMACFREDRFGDGIASAIRSIGEKLQAFFPCQRDDINELPDEISYSL